MPRPQKCRKVCRLPDTMGFLPVNDAKPCGEIVLSVDEYEAVRLIDLEGFSQEECGEYMTIARTTVQQIYNNARQKLARMLVEGLPLKIEGGNYRLCSGQEKECGCGGCKRHRISESTGDSTGGRI